MPRARTRTLARVLPLLIAILLVPRALAAQAVEGTLVEEGRETPIPGALVTLLGPDDRPLARGLTDAQGRFVLRAPAAGMYRVRADRIGFGSTTSAPLELAAGQTAPLRLAASGQVVRLQGIRAEARSTRRCIISREAGAQVATLWEEARKALSLAELTREQQGYTFTVRTFRRTLHPATRMVRSETGRSLQTRSLTPFLSAPAEELAADGYVRVDSAGVAYFSPDARVLLSDVFLAGHCFQVEEPADGDTTRVGLAFEPVRGRDLPDVKGVLWLDRRTAELRSLDFAYTSFPIGHGGDWGGRVEFSRVENGGWVVQSWLIRMPVYYEQPTITGDRVAGTELAQVIEEGGEVERVAAPGGGVTVLARRGTVSGVVVDSTRGAPLAGARVYLAGTPYGTESDSAGRFTIRGVPEALYGVSFAHPRADSLEFDPAPVPARVRVDGDVAVRLAIAGVPAARVAAVGEAGRRASVRAAQTDPGAALRLDAVSATAERQTRLLTNQGFYQRQRGFPGTFLTEADVREKPANRVMDFIVGKHGTSPRFPNGVVLLVQRRMGEPCRVPLYVDGVLSPHAVLERLRPADVAAIEVYGGPHVPAQFNPYPGGFACGAVVIWTKDGVS